MLRGFIIKVTPPIFFLLSILNLSGNWRISSHCMYTDMCNEVPNTNLCTFDCVNMLCEHYYYVAMQMNKKSNKFCDLILSQGNSHE